MVAREILWSSRRIRSTRWSALRCPSWRRNTLTIRSRLLERRPPAGRKLSMYAACSISLDVEGAAAAAGGLRVRVLDREPAARDVVDEVHFGALQIPQADRIDEQLHALHLEHLIDRRVAFALVNHQPVLEAGAAAALDEYPQTSAELVFFAQQLANLRRCRFSDVNHRVGNLPGRTARPQLYAPPPRPLCGCKSS